MLTPIKSPNFDRFMQEEIEKARLDCLEPSIFLALLEPHADKG